MTGSSGHPLDACADVIKVKFTKIQEEKRTSGHGSNSQTLAFCLFVCFLQTQTERQGDTTVGYENDKNTVHFFPPSFFFQLNNVFFLCLEVVTMPKDLH